MLCSLVDVYSSPFSFPHLFCHQIVLVFCLFSYPLCCRNSWSSVPSLLSFICNPLLHPVFSHVSLLLQNGHFSGSYSSTVLHTPIGSHRDPFLVPTLPILFTSFSMLCLPLYAEEGGITFLPDVSKHPPDQTALHYGRE
jgi:hypothetical protein